MITETTDVTLEALERAQVKSFPYPHFVVDQLLDDEEADALLRWFEEDAKWWEQRRDFYNHDTCENLSDCPMTREGALSAATRGAIARSLSRQFGLELDTEDVTLGAHRMKPGHRLGIHTDSPEIGTEYVRLLLTLRRGEYEDEYGGHLCLFSGPEMKDLATITRPLHNSAVAFLLSPTSYHAVADTNEGTRYSLVFGFWDKRQVRAVPPAAKSRGGRRAAAASSLPPDFARLLSALREAGAGGVPHSGDSLVEHLAGVASILFEWEADADVCKAGLFHSVYGTETFDHALFKESERARVRALIGERAERLVWLFSTVRWSEVYRYRGERDYTGRSRKDSTEMKLSPGEIKDLNLLAAANMVDQLEHLSLGPSEVFEWRQALANMDSQFPPKAVAALHELLGLDAKEA